MELGATACHPICAHREISVGRRHSELGHGADSGGEGSPLAAVTEAGLGTVLGDAVDKLRTMGGWGQG